MVVIEEYIAWSDKFSCGIKLIDDQHKQLVELVNEMFNHATGNAVQERDYFDRVINEAVEYIKTHFITEEKIMIAAKFKGYEEHKKEHLNFIVTVIEKAKDFQAGKRLTLSSFARYLKDWVLSHIAVMDKQYFEYFKNIATRKDDGRLSINSADVRRAQ